MCVYDRLLRSESYVSDAQSSEQNDPYTNTRIARSASSGTPIIIDTTAVDTT
jgi:hypothetical protein